MLNVDCTIPVRVTQNTVRYVASNQDMSGDLLILSIGGFHIVNKDVPVGERNFRELIRCPAVDGEQCENLGHKEVFITTKHPTTKDIIEFRLFLCKKHLKKYEELIV